MVYSPTYITAVLLVVCIEHTLKTFILSCLTREPANVHELKVATVVINTLTTSGSNNTITVRTKNNCGALSTATLTRISTKVRRNSTTNNTIIYTCWQDCSRIIRRIRSHIFSGIVPLGRFILVKELNLQEPSRPNQWLGLKWPTRRQLHRRAHVRTMTTVQSPSQRDGWIISEHDEHGEIVKRHCNILYAHFAGCKNIVHPMTRLPGAMLCPSPPRGKSSCILEKFVYSIKRTIPLVLSHLYAIHWLRASRDDECFGSSPHSNTKSDNCSIPRPAGMLLSSSHILCTPRPSRRPWGHKTHANGIKHHWELYIATMRHIYALPIALYLLEAVHDERISHKEHIQRRTQYRAPGVKSNLFPHDNFRKGPTLPWRYVKRRLENGEWWDGQKGHNKTAWR